MGKQVGLEQMRLNGNTPNWQKVRKGDEHRKSKDCV